MGRERILELGETFAVGIYAYAVMSNHLHVVVRLDPSLAWSWSAEEVARRWVSLFPVRDAGEVDDQATATRAQLIDSASHDASTAAASLKSEGPHLGPCRRGCHRSRAGEQDAVKAMRVIRSILLLSLAMAASCARPPPVTLHIEVKPVDYDEAVILRIWDSLGLERKQIVSATDVAALYAESNSIFASLTLLRNRKSAAIEFVPKANEKSDWKAIARAASQFCKQLNDVGSVTYVLRFDRRIVELPVLQKDLACQGAVRLE